MNESQTNPTEHPEVSRRRFLLGLAAAAGAAGMAGSLASGAQPNARPVAERPVAKAKPRLPLAEGEPIRMGVIGTGGMGTSHCDAFCSLVKQGRENVQIVAISDVCKPRLENALRRCREHQPGVQVDAYYGSHRQLLARGDLHGVLIASPEHWHEVHAVDALLAGTDVYLEKPMTLRLDEAIRLREVVLANPDLRLQVGTQMTNLPKYHEARKVIASGTIGKPVWSQTSYCRNSRDGEWNYYNIDPNWQDGVNIDWREWCGPLGAQAWDPVVYARWRRYRKYSTGIIGDLLVHVLTPMLVAIEPGWPTRVVASGGHYIDKAMENHDQVNINIEFDSGHTMVLAGSTANEVGLETMIRGHMGNIYLGGRNCVVRPERIYADDVDMQTIECEDIGNDQDVHRLKWLECIRTRVQPDSDIEQGTKVMVMVDLATRSMWDGGAYEFDSKTMQTRKL